MIKNNTLLNAPHLIFNTDETEMLPCSCPGLAVKGSVCAMQD